VTAWANIFWRCGQTLQPTSGSGFFKIGKEFNRAALPNHATAPRTDQARVSSHRFAGLHCGLTTHLRVFAALYRGFATPSRPLAGHLGGVAALSYQFARLHRGFATPPHPFAGPHRVSAAHSHRFAGHHRGFAALSYQFARLHRGFATLPHPFAGPHRVSAAHSHRFGGPYRGFASASLDIAVPSPRFAAPSMWCAASDCQLQRHFRFPTVVMRSNSATIGKSCSRSFTPFVRRVLLLLPRVTSGTSTFSGRSASRECDYLNDRVR